MFGLLNLNKPAGWTSRDVVNRVQRLVRPAKAGHAGTLDPLATGVLVVCVGPATRLIDYVQLMPKRYVGTFQLGVSSPSDDTELECTPVAEAPQPTLAQLEQALPAFTGEIQQRPPAYSAIKVKGKKAYELARRGDKVELPPRPVSIHSLEIVRYEYPELVLDITCGSGTYIRSLGRDLAQLLGTAAVMSALERTAIGNFRIQQAATPDEVLHEGVGKFLEPPTKAIGELPRRTLSHEQVQAIRQGKTVARTADESGELAGVDSEGRLVAILVPRGAGGLGPRMVFG